MCELFKYLIMEKHNANDSNRSKAKKDKSNLKKFKSPDLSNKKRVPVYMETMYGTKFSHYKFI